MRVLGKRPHPSDEGILQRLSKSGLREWAAGALDGRGSGAVLLRGLLTPAQAAAAAARVRAALARADGGPWAHAKFLTATSGNGEHGMYAPLARADRAGTALDALWRALADALADGDGGAERLARAHEDGEGCHGEALLLLYGEGGVNWAHRDQTRGCVYAFQALVCLSTPGRDYAGGEFYVEDGGADAARDGGGGGRTCVAFERPGDVRARLAARCVARALGRALWLSPVPTSHPVVPSPPLRSLHR